MNGVALIETLKSRGIRLTADHGKLKFSAPPGAMTPDLLESMANCKPLIMRLLNEERQTPLGQLDAMLSGVWRDDPHGWRLDFEERAAIHEFDGGMSRNDAENAALARVKQIMEEQC